MILGNIFYRLDAHFTHFGAGVLIHSVLNALGEQKSTGLAAHLNQAGNRQAGWEDDLG